MKKNIMEPDIEGIRRWQEERENIEEKINQTPTTPWDYAMKVAETADLREKKRLLLNLNGQFNLDGRQQTLTLIRQLDDTFQNN